MVCDIPAGDHGKISNLFLQCMVPGFSSSMYTFSGHNASHMSVIPIEKVFAKNKDSLKLRESEWIKEFGTLVPRGMNIKS